MYKVLVILSYSLSSFIIFMLKLSINLGLTESCFIFVFFVKIKKFSFCLPLVYSLFRGLIDFLNLLLHEHRECWFYSH